MSFSLRQWQNLPDKETYESLIFSRNPPNSLEILSKKHVGIAGLGGLGSNIAVMLARSGVGKMTLVDFDVIDPSNLNRQHYFNRHVGQKKTEALRQQLLEINPYLEIHSEATYIDHSNFSNLYGDVDLLVEAFDVAQNKSMLVEAWGTKLPHVPMVSASGMAGIEGFDSIHYKKLGKNLHLVGDFKTEAASETGLASPRVTLVASMQALLVLRLLLGKETQNGQE